MARDGAATLEFVGISMFSLVGPGGSTLRSVKEDSGAEVKLRRAGDAVVVDISGEPDQVAHAESLMNDIATNAEQEQADDVNVTETLKFPLAAAGVVLGTGGSNAKKIRSQFKVEVGLEKQERVCLVHVSGPREQVDEALQAIQELVDQSGSAPAASSREGPDSDEAVTETLTFPMRLFGKLCGKGGSNIKSFSANSGAKVKLDKTDTNALIHISGDADQVKKAKALIDDLTGEDMREDGAAGEAEAKETMSFPMSLFGKICGKGGENIKSFQKKTGTKIILEKSDSVCLVHISGGADQVDQARGLIEEFTADDMLQAAGPTAHEVRETLTFPQNMFGLLCGKGGGNIKSIRAQTGAKVALEKSDSAVTVIMTGAASQVKKAKAMVEECTAEDTWPGAAKAAGGAGEEWDEGEDGSDKLDFEEIDYLYIVGQGGQAIKDARHATGAGIVARKIGGRCEVTISGTPDQLERARAHVEGLVEAGREAGPAPRKDRRDDEDHEVITIGSKDGGRIIGMGGSTVKAVMQETGAHVCVEKADNTVHIRGSVEAVDKARMMVNNLLAADVPFKEMQWATDHYIKISHAESVRIVGKAGVVKKEIQEETWAKLDIPIPKDQSQPCLVRIEGTFDAVEKALAKIQGILSGGHVSSGGGGGVGGHSTAAKRVSPGAEKWKSEGADWSKDDWGGHDSKRQKWSSDSWTG